MDPLTDPGPVRREPRTRYLRVVLHLVGLAAAPEDYSFNNADVNAAPLHASGQTGNGVIVAVIDSGTANWSGVSALSGTVMGGENFVPGATEPSPIGQPA